MLKPDKHLDFSKSLIKRTSQLIMILKEENFQPFKQLFVKYTVRNPGADFTSFILSLDFLYCLGKIQYIKENDLVRLVENEIK